MKKFITILLTTALLLALTACGRVSQEEHDRLQQEIDELRGQIGVNDSSAQTTTTPVATDKPIVTEKTIQVGEWTYFIETVEGAEEEEQDYPFPYPYPALFRSSKDNEKVKISVGGCWGFDVANDSLYYLDGLKGDQDHCSLYIIPPDSKEKIKLESELHSFQIVDNQYIYFSYRHTTVGVGNDGFALHRMNLDGTERIIAAYSAYSPVSVDYDRVYVGFKGFEIRDNYVVYRSSYSIEESGENFEYRMELGSPATGLERVESIGYGNGNEWIVYNSNHYIIRARKDGSEQIILDDMSDLESYYWTISKIEDGWIYYDNQNRGNYKILADGTGQRVTEEYKTTSSIRLTATASSNWLYTGDAVFSNDSVRMMSRSAESTFTFSMNSTQFTDNAKLRVYYNSDVGRYATIYVNGQGYFDLSFPNTDWVWGSYIEIEISVKKGNNEIKVCWSDLSAWSPDFNKFELLY